ncbi:hypothetical protein PRZ48_003057 [Zasmidium cellare]|uniref:Uncharacterized protein n=1 Tax=Zasmidium cellare TaxID=395010 RepID=A0ABR0EUK8_ZASCE|nr:hypothetical protein PRZ48_003057 [Zasmidium cellare]
MTASEYHQYEQGHLYRRANEVDEETVGEWWRIMLNQAILDSQREELRYRLDKSTKRQYCRASFSAWHRPDNPSPSPSTNGYSYNTSQALTSLWQHTADPGPDEEEPTIAP